MLLCDSRSRVQDETDWCRNFGGFSQSFCCARPVVGEASDDAGSSSNIRYDLKAAKLKVTEAMT
jgi:hypothetical protein